VQYDQWRETVSSENAHRKNGNSKSPHTNDELDGEDAVETENEAQH
jgi:hypothetical protein